MPPIAELVFGAAVSAIATDLIAELDFVMAAGPPERRLRILRRVAAMLFADADRLTDQHLSIFDDVLVRLMEHADPPILTKLSEPLAALKAVPREVARRLAGHEDPAVALPILSRCECLSEADLIEIARTRGERHLGAIAMRRVIGRDLTDALLASGNTAIGNILARNSGAQFFEAGFATLVDMAERDDDVAFALVARLDLPPQVLRDLVAKCTPAVQAQLFRKALPARHAALKAAIESAAASVRSRKPEPVDYTQARATALALNNSGQLNDSTVNRFAIRQEHRNIVAALAQLATAPIEIIAPLMEAPDCYGLAVACKASRLNWQTTAAIIANRKAGAPPRQQLDELREAFEALPLSNAQRTLRFGSPAELAARPAAAGAR